MDGSIFAEAATDESADVRAAAQLGPEVAARMLRSAVVREPCLRVFLIILWVIRLIFAVKADVRPCWVQPGKRRKKREDAELAEGCSLVISVLAVCSS